ncbi:hypothetical protein Nepgr_017803 [Nepenthes gracilis]|uniref:Uncharacterized protein n=1 Tax=Nepenthes gracilis TaxID=150966 RepID=A0AAD3SSZ0_NEPGR|nr:hypothetical protein Nepgr_017803 [Nepenthes gracilis]
MASSMFLSASTGTVALCVPLRSTSSAAASAPSTSYASRHISFWCWFSFKPFPSQTRLLATGIGCFRRAQVVCMAPEEEKMTRRSPLDFPIEWERPKPGRRPDIFPQFSPMKTPLPPPLPADPPEEDEEDEEKKEEEEEDPEKEEPDKPEKQQ